MIDETENVVRLAISILTGLSLFASSFGPNAYAAEGSKPLTSPWDREIYHASERDEACPTLPTLSQSLTVTGYYTDKNHSIIDPERLSRYKDATQSLYDTAKLLTKLADTYQQKGSVSAASCTVKSLAGLAQAKILTGKMEGNQATYVQGWTLGALSIAWLKVRNRPDITPDNRGEITAWLGTIAEQNKGYYDKRPKAEDARNNHRYWAGLAVSAAGIAANRRDLFDWGVESARIGLRQVTADGSLPLEMGRRAKALHYHLFALMPLVVEAELADANGIDLYRENDGALKRLAQFSLSGIKDSGPIEKAAGIAQEPVDLAGGTVGWLIPYQRRFPTADQKAILDKMTSKTMLYIGGLPPA